MKRMQSGFTLIELVVVIVILGILAVTAVPRFIDLSQEATDAALQGVVGSIESASAINYAAAMAGDAAAATTAGVSCESAVVNLLPGGVPDGYTLDSTTTLSTTEGTVSPCTVTPDEPGAIPSLSANIISVTP